MKRCLLLLLLTFPMCLIAQFQDNFTDGDFTTSPTWTGETSNFDITANRLHLNAPAVAASAYLSTPSAAIHNASWEFYVEMGFATSSTSLTRVYLVSDQANLKQSLNGYFVMIGNTDDEISLYRQTGTTITKIIDGLNARVASTTVSVKIKVTRDAAALWTLSVDVGNTGNYIQEASSVADATHTISNYVGVYCLYTATRSTLFWFDDFTISGTPLPDLSPPTITQVSAISEKQVSIIFSEELQLASAETTNNYWVNDLNPSIALLQANSKTVHLTLQTPLTNGLDFQTRVASVADVSGNAMSQSTNQALYFVQYPVSKKDLIISEFMADQSPTVGLPEAEFVEIFNRSINPVQLQDWKLTDGSSTATLSSYILLPGAYVVVTTTSGAGLLSSAMGVNNFPSLNNSGDNIILKTNNHVTIDSIQYTSAWYANADKQDGGWSLEIIDPDNTCGEETNWKASNSPNGGTPGLVNSVKTSNPDTSGPWINSAIVESANQIRVVFNEKLAKENSIAADLNNGLAISAITYAMNLKEVILITDSPLQPSTPYTLSLVNVFDCAGNTLIQGTTQIILPEKALTNDVVINEILFNPEPGGVDFVEVYNRSNKYIDITNWSLSNIASGGPVNQRFQPNPILLSPRSYIVFTADTAVLIAQFPQTNKYALVQMSVPSMPDAGGTIALVDNTFTFIDSLTYSEQWHYVTNREGVSLERMSFNTTPQVFQNWRSAWEKAAFATPGFINSTTIPFITETEATNSNTITVSFNEFINSASVSDPSKFIVQGIATQYTALLSDGRSVRVELINHMENGQHYQLQVYGIEDLDGNYMEPVEIMFQFFQEKPIAYKDIIIAEIMADPSPVVGLPEGEYIEIFNRSPNPIQLQQMRLSDGVTTASLSYFVLMPGSHLAITSTTAQPLFSNAMAVQNFPSLANGGESLTLKNDIGTTIDSISYSPNWYHSNDKAEGGWSLEIIDPENLCEEENNWTASESSNGGTPGVVNSVHASNPDITPPVITSATIDQFNNIVVNFSEKLDGNPQASVSFDPPIIVQSFQYRNNLRQIFITTPDNLNTSTPFTMILSGVSDCTGNPLISEAVELIKPDNAVSGDIVLNEVLFNPKSGGVDFVEVYNTSEKYISLENWSFANIENASAVNLKTLESNSIISPKSFKVFTSDPVILKSHYPRTVEEVCIATTLPSMNDDEGSIAIIDNLNNVLDFFVYLDDYHNAFVKDDEGVSLERVSISASTHDPNNWRSASQYENFATPGYKNSSSLDGKVPIDGEVVIEPEIFSPQVPPSDFTTINYKFNQSGKVANAQILDQQGRLIKVLANNEVLGTEGFFRWDGDRDDGARARAGFYVAWLEVFDTQGNVTSFWKRVVISFR